MSNNDVIEKLVVPGPSQVVSEQLHVYIPVATTTTPGIAKYNSDYFDVNDGLVTLKNVPGNLIQGISINDDGTLTIQYWRTPDGEIGNSVKIPLVYVEDADLKVIKSGLVTIAEFNEDNWWYNEKDGQYYKFISHERTSQSNENFLAILEDFVDTLHVNTSDYNNLVMTMPDNIFKTKNGDIILFAANPFAGRVVMSGSWLLDKNKLYTFGYKEDTNELTLRWVDGTEKTVRPLLFGDIVLGEGEFSKPGVVDKKNYKLTLFAPTGNTAHAYQWSVIDIINPGVGTQQLKIGITGGDNRWGQIEYSYGENADKHVKLNFREDGLYVVQNNNYSYDVAKKLAVVDDILSKALSRTGDTITGQFISDTDAGGGEAIQLFRKGSKSLYIGTLLDGNAQIRSPIKGAGLIFKRDGVYFTEKSSNDAGSKLFSGISDVLAGYTYTIDLRGDVKQRLKFVSHAPNIKPNTDANGHLYGLIGQTVKKNADDYEYKILSAFFRTTDTLSLIVIGNAGNIDELTCNATFNRFSDWKEVEL